MSEFLTWLHPVRGHLPPPPPTNHTPTHNLDLIQNQIPEQPCKVSLKSLFIFYLISQPVSKHIGIAQSNAVLHLVALCENFFPPGVVRELKSVCWRLIFFGRKVPELAHHCRHGSRRLLGDLWGHCSHVGRSFLHSFMLPSCPGLGFEEVPIAEALFRLFEVQLLSDGEAQWITQPRKDSAGVFPAPPSNSVHEKVKRKEENKVWKTSSD